MATKNGPTAKPLASHFVTKKRGRGKDAPSFVTLRDTRPDWLRAAVYDAHCEDLPNDWIYAECLAACKAIDAGDLGAGAYPEDTIHEYADGRVDIYTRDRYQWAADFCLSGTMAHAEEALEDRGGHTGTLADRLGALQYCAIEAIAATILHAYETNGAES